LLHVVGRDGAAGIATRYGLDGPGIEPRFGRGFPYPSRPALGSPSLLYNGYRISFPGVKWPGRGVDHPSPSSAKFKERVELSFPGVKWPGRGVDHPPPHLVPRLKKE
jgi:hypothetical protein